MNKFMPYTGDLMGLPTNELEIFKKRIDINLLEEHCKTLEQIDCPVEHEFADGVYVRKTSMPKGVFAIGERHRYRTINILLEGEISVYMGGDKAVVKKAPCTFISEAGVKKMAYFHEDTVWINVHPTDETDVRKIQEMFIIPEEEYLLTMQEKNKIEG